MLIGGPVQPERGFVLHEPGDEWDSTRVSDALSLTTSRDMLPRWRAARARSDADRARLRRWSEGQLETELQDNTWLTVPPIARSSTPRWNSAGRRGAAMGVDLRLTDYAGHA